MDMLRGNCYMDRDKRFCCRKFAILWKISQYEVFRWLCYTLTLLFIYFIMFSVLNQTKQMNFTNNYVVQKPETKVVYSPRCAGTQCDITTNKHLFIILILEENTTQNQLSMIYDTWSRDIKREDILYVVRSVGQINLDTMSRYYISDTPDEEDTLSLIFHYLHEYSLLETYPWYLVLKSTSVYVRVDQLISAVSDIDPSLMLEFGVVPNNRLCSVEFGVLFSEAFIREITQCVSDREDDVMIESMLRRCLRWFDVKCITDTVDKLGMLFSTEISHMSNILAAKPKDMENAILINTPASNEVFYLLKSAFHQEKYLELHNKIENDIFGKSVNGKDFVNFPENELRRDFWMEISDSTLVSSLTTGHVKLQQEQSREIYKIGESIYEQNKQSIGLSNYNFLELTDTVIEQTYQKRIYHFTGLVEDKFPDYKYIYMQKEDKRNTDGYIHSIVPLHTDMSDTKIAIILLLDDTAPSDSVDNFAMKNSEILSQPNIQHFTIQMNPKQRKYEKKLLQGLLTDVLKDSIIILLTSPIEIHDTLIDTAQQLTLKGHQAYTAICMDTLDGDSFMSIYAQDLLSIKLDIWVDCHVRNIISCVRNGIQTDSRVIVLDTNDIVCE